MTQETICEVDNSVLLSLASEIVVSYVGRNSVPADELPELIKSVYHSLKSVDAGDSSQSGVEPAVPIKKSYTRDHIICLEDGKKLKMLKRYLRTRYQMTPEEYRAKWGLPPDYPMVAPSYAERRSTFAKKIGLGKKK